MNQFDQAPAQKKSSLLKWILIGIGLFSIICIAICGVFFFLALQEIEKIEEAYGETIVGMCNPISTETVASDINLDDTYPRQIVIFGESDLTRHAWFNNLPKSWQADNKDEVDLVVCIREKEEVIEECEYTFDDEESSETAVLQRVQYKADLFIFTADGDLVNTVEVNGKQPFECPDTRRIRGTEKEKADKVTYAQFEDTIRPLIESGAE